jgi:hypothetical protein
VVIPVGFLATIMLSEVSLLIAVSARVPISDQAPVITLAFFVNSLMLTIQIMIVLIGEKLIDDIKKRYMKLKMRINEFTEEEQDTETGNTETGINAGLTLSDSLKKDLKKKLRLTTTVNLYSINKRSETISHVDGLLSEIKEVEGEENERKANVMLLKQDLVKAKTQLRQMYKTDFIIFIISMVIYFIFSIVVIVAISL